MITANNIAYSLEKGEEIFSNISFSLGPEKTGLVGDNGVGKTTLLKIIVGEVNPTAGVIHNDESAAYLPQDYQFDLSKSIGEVIEPNIKILKFLKLDHIDFDRKFSDLSGGERTKMALAKILSAQTDFIIMDEPTNNLDEESREVVYKFIREWKNGLLVVSHDRELLNLMDQIYELSSKGLKKYGSNYDNYVIQKETESAAAERELSNAEQSYTKAKKQFQRTKEKQAKKSERGKKNIFKLGISGMAADKMRDTSEKTHSHIIRTHEKNIEEAKTLVNEARNKILPSNEIIVDLPDTSVPEGKIILKLTDVSFSYKENDIIKNLSSTVHGPSHLAIVGNNGSGKTTLAKLIVGELKPTHGDVTVGASNVAYLDQTLNVLRHGDTLLHNMKTISKLDENTSRRMLAHYLFRGDDVFKTIMNLSGGERMRAALACLLSKKEPPQLLILDEPTNNLDINSIEKIESMLSNYRGALLVISHDQSFLENVGVNDYLRL